MSNGTRGTITAVDPAAGTITFFDDEHDRQVTLPRSYLRTRVGRGRRAEGSVQHAYACTVHRAQGITVQDETLFKIGASMPSEALYVGASRSKTRTQFYAVGAPAAHDEVDLPRDRFARDVRVQLVADVARLAPEELAVDAQARGWRDVHTMRVGELRAERDALTTLLEAEAAEAGTGTGSGAVGRGARSAASTRRLALALAEEALTEAEQTAQAAQTQAGAASATAATFRGPRRLMRRAQATAADYAATVAAWRAEQARAVVRQAREREVAARQAHQQAKAAQERTTPERARLDAVLRELGWRRSARRTALRLEQPEHLTGLLGRYPAAGPSAERRAWMGAAEAITTYRDRHQLTDTDPARALGDQPAELRQRAEWQQLCHMASQVREQTRDPLRDQRPSRAHDQDGRAVGL